MEAGNGCILIRIIKQSVINQLTISKQLVSAFNF